MDDNLNRRINDILKSVEGGRRAKPKTDLLAKIEYQIYNQEATIIPIRQLKLIAVAAILLLFVNIITISIYLNQEKHQPEYTTSIIMDYKLYD